LLYSFPTTSLFAIGRLCEVVFGIEAHYGALLPGGVALACTLMGGLMAVAITDMIEFVLMSITVAVGVPLLMMEIGGFDAVQAVALVVSAIVIFACFVRDAREYIENERRKGNDSGGGPTNPDR